MICWKCKQEMPDGLRYCGNCGVRMNRTLYALEWLFSKKGLPVLLGVLAVVIVAAGMLLWTNREPEKHSALEAAITEKIQNEIVPGEDVPIAYAYSNAVLEAITFTVEKDNVKEGIATVTFTYVDTIAMADSYGTRQIDPAVYYQECIDAILGGTAPTVTETIEITYTVLVTEGSEEYAIEDSLALADVMTGGAASAYLELIGEVQ